MVPGSVVQLIATATFSDGSTLGVTRQSAWVSSSQGVATVGSDITVGGYVQALAAGSANIQASYQGKAANASLAVSSVPEKFAITASLQFNNPSHKPAGSITIHVAPTVNGTPQQVQWSCNAPSTQTQQEDTGVFSCTFSLPAGSYAVDSPSFGGPGCKGWTVQGAGQTTFAPTQCVPDNLSTADAYFALFSVDATGRVGG
jgi:hypothetical protein